MVRIAGSVAVILVTLALLNTAYQLIRKPTELFVQVLNHRWRLSEDAGRDVGLAPAVQSFLADVLVHRPDEQAVLGFTP